MKNQSAGKSKLIYIFTGMLVILAIIGFAFWQVNNQASNIQVTAQLEDGTHISLSGIFNITGSGDLDIDQLASRLVIEPQMEFSLTPDGSDTVILQIYRPLIAGRTIFIKLLDENGREQKHWDFETSAQFQVMDVFPAKDAQGVNPNTSMEITFSYDDFDPESMDEYFTVSPAIEGRFIKRFNKLVYTYYNEGFSPDTTYTVTISGELPRVNGELLGEDYSFSFTTGQYDSYEYFFNDKGSFTENLLPDEVGTISLYIGEAIQDQEIVTTIYQYPDGKDYLAALRLYRDELVRRSYSYNYSRLTDWNVDTGKLIQVMQFNSRATTKSANGYGDKCVVMPDTLPEGWYVAKLETLSPSGESKSFYKLIQSNGLAVYYAQSRDMSKDEPNQLITWINDTATGKPVENANISVTASNYNVAGRTAKDGIAVLEGHMAFIDRYGQDDNLIIRDDSADVYGLLTVDSGSKPFYDLFGVYYYGAGNPSNPYYAYLFADRPVYRPTDTVKVWGLIKARQEGDPLPEELSLNLSDLNEPVPVTPAWDGTFQCEIKLEQYRTGWTWLNLYDEKADYASLGVKIESYIKPVYETTAQPDKPVFTDWGDKGADFSFHAAYYEGTPAQDYKATMRTPEDYSSMPFSEVNIATDAKGDARVSVRPDPASVDSWRPQQVHYGIYSIDALDSPQIHGGSFGYIYRDIMVTSNVTTGAKPSVTIFTNKVDVSRIKNEADLLVEDNLKGAAVDTELTAEIHRVYYKKTPNGERYDAINKISVTAYDYEYTNDIIETLRVRTQDGRYEFQNLPENDDENSYYLELTVKDTRGLPVNETVYYGWSLKNYQWGSVTDFKLMIRESEDKYISRNDTYYRYWDTVQFVDDETCVFDLKNDLMELVDNPDGQMFYCISQQRILDYGLVNGTQLSIPFNEKHLPNYSLTGAYFDGRHIFALRYTEIEYNPEKRELEIAVSPDKKSYEPGQSADITLRVTEKDSGKPAANAKVVAAVVDEAVFAIQEQTPDFLKKLYHTIGINYVIQYTSYNNHSTDGGGRGGGGPDAFTPRENFQDTAAFTVLTTDQSGEAAMKVSLPDNLTSWRVTALALTADLKAGDTKERFAVSQDFFVTPVIPLRILEGDDLVVTVHSAGRTTTPEDLVDYTCQVDGFGEMRAFQGKAGDFTPAAMGRLPLGDYLITVSGKNGDNSDAVRVPVQVVKSGIDVSVSQKISPQDAPGIRSTSYPVMLGFYNKAYALRTDILGFLTSCRGIRTDQRVAQRYVQEQLLLSSVDVNRLDSVSLNDSFSNAMSENYLYRLFPYSETSISFSARMSTAIPDYYRGSCLSMEELSEVADTTERAAGYLLYTLYNQDKKTRRQITEQLESGNYNTQGKLYLITALSKAGDNEAAEKWYSELLTASVLQEQINADGHRMAGFLQDGKVSGSRTVTAYMAAIQLNRADDADAFTRYLLANPPTDDLAALEYIFYLRQFPADTVKDDEQISYKQNGAVQTIKLGEVTQYRSFSREELEQVNLHSQSGNVGVTAYYTASYTDAANRENKSLLLTKTIEAADGDILYQGGLAKITLKLTVPSNLSLSAYTNLCIDDYIPTGMRYEYMQSGDWYLSARNDQRVSFNVALDKNDTLVYYARCVAQGQYIGESAFASVDVGMVWGDSGRTQVSIREK